MSKLTLYHQLVNNDIFAAELSSYTLKVTLEYLKNKKSAVLEKKKARTTDKPAL